MAAPVFFGHERLRAAGDVDALTVSPDGRLLAVGSTFGDEASLWTLPDLRLVGRVPESAGSFAFSPRGDALWLSYAHTHVWDYGRGWIDGLARIPELAAPIALSPDGTRIVGSRPPGAREEIVLYDTRSDEIVWTTATAGPAVSSVAFTPDGARIAVGEPHGARILDAETGRTLERLNSPRGQLRWIAQEPQGELLVVGAEGSEWIDIGVGRGARTRVAQLPFGLGRLAIAPEGRRLAVLGAGGEVAIVELSDGSVRVLPLEPRAAGREAVAIAGNLVAFADHRSVSLFDLDAWALVPEQPGHRDRITAIAPAPDGRWIATAGGFDRTVRLWWSTSGAHLRAFEGHENQVNDVSVSPDGSRVATACADGTLRIFEVEGDGSAPEVVIAAAHTHAHLVGVRHLPGGQALVTLGDDGAVRLWRGSAGRTIAQVGARGFTGVARGLAISPDGRWIAASGSDHEVLVLDVASGADVFSRRKGGQVLAFASHAPWLALREPDATVVLEIPSGAVVRRWPGLRAIAAAFDEGGRLAIASYADPPVVVDPRRDVEGIVPEGVPGPATAVTFAPDGRLALGLRDGRAMLVEVPETPLSPRELDLREVQRRRDAARALLATLAAHRLPAGYRDSLLDVHVEEGGLGVVVTRGPAIVRVVAFVPDAKTTELRLTVHAPGAVPPPSPRAPEPATFAARLARWIRRRLGVPDGPDGRADAPWLAALPGMDLARSARIEVEEGVFGVTVELDVLPPPADLLAWVDACAAQVATGG